MAGTDHLPLAITPEEARSVSRHGNITLVKPKRQHRKSHGKIGFRDLARTIAQRWKTVDAANRQVLEDQARVEKLQYANALRLWKEQQQETQQLAATAASEQEQTQASLAFPLSATPFQNDLSMEQARHRIDYLQTLRSQIESEIQNHLQQSQQQDVQQGGLVFLSNNNTSDEDLLEPLQVESASPMCVPSFPRTTSVQNILFSLAHMDEDENTSSTVQQEQHDFSMDSSFLFWVLEEI